MRLFLALVVLAALSVGARAGEIREGAVMQVKPNSIWFEDVTQLRHWQQLKKRGDEAAVAAFVAPLLQSRDAWQFVYPIAVKILGYKPGAAEVGVEMKTPGRFEGTQWVIDAGTLVR